MRDTRTDSTEDRLCEIDAHDIVSVSHEGDPEIPAMRQTLGRRHLPWPARPRAQLSGVPATVLVRAAQWRRHDRMRTP